MWREAKSSIGGKTKSRCVAVRTGWLTKGAVGTAKGSGCSGVSGDDAGETEVGGGGTLISALVYEQLATAN